jgi:putative addiction module component (TIGR02574 family)
MSGANGSDGRIMNTDGKTLAGCSILDYSQDMSQLLEQALKLSLADRQRLVDDISASITAESEAAPLSDEQMKEIDRRIAGYIGTL